MNDIPDAEIRGRALYLSAEETVVVADLHLGRGHSAGVELPVDQAATVGAALERVLDYWEPARVVLAGDILDAFETVPPGVEGRLVDLLDTVLASDAKIDVLGGNHDVLLSSLLDVEVRTTCRVGESLVAHGHDPVEQTADCYVVGHQHPTVRIEGVKRPCFLVGPAPDGATVVVLPAFSPAVRGTVMNRRRDTDLDASFLRRDALDQFRPIVWDETAEESLVFPPFASLRPFL